MSKIGILTFHRAGNYGAVLQTYALQTAIEKLGAKAEIIDYHCPEVEIAHHPYYGLKKNGLKFLPRAAGKVIKYNRFQSFRKKYLHLSKKVDADSIKYLESEYDKIIAGSDQVWNNNFSGGDEQFFLPFAPSEKKCTYAVSIGDNYDQTWLNSMLKKNGQDFGTISLREKSSVDFVSGVTNHPCRVDVDPTFLLTKDEWFKIAKNSDHSKPYILLYTVAGTDELVNHAKETAKKTGYDLIYINNSFNQNKDIRKVRYITPDAFIGYFSEAEFIFTNSFHGTAFSILLNRRTCWRRERSGRTRRCC